MQDNKPHISVVSPVYKAENIVHELVSQLHANLRLITDNYEIILVNDDSPDDSWNMIVDECAKDVRVKGINLSRNFGQHYAITAGLNYAKGDWVVVMDCDLQDRPEEIPNLYQKAQDGWDIVLGKRFARKDHFLKKSMNYLFYKIFNYLTDASIDRDVGTFRIMNQSVVKNYNKLKEQSRYFGGLMNWLGFKVIAIEIRHDDRFEGTSSYSFNKLITLTLNAILSFSDKPLRIAIKLGMCITLFSVIFIIYKIVHMFLYNSTVMGWSSIIASIFFSTGLIISILGIVGLYIGRIFEETKNRPLYVIRETKNI